MPRKVQRLVILFMGFLSLVGQSHAQPSGMPELIVVADYGGEPARPYYVAIGAAGIPEAEGFEVTDTSTRPASKPFSEQDMLPVRSELLSPGQVTPRRLTLPRRMTPFFLIGSDEVSHQWLAQRRNRLHEMNAVGLVVNVEDNAVLTRLREVGQGLELRPVSGDDIAGRLGIAHYPVLVTPDGLTQ
ncbi:hypothetical protein L861_06480 [Litchfieldella anticariensis FP35 = DSM 16096]|uniref:Integrating conjugative element protein n=1 Tax=Litchfieldella anticariensis (strain DSM 16096 / CECT 5854 / CIP 108499 / LMG 22089 / FP35) TaxID=1121939 RepID=S2KF89_LITA3|nr:integrating conjugative element protein [Halomonas anticariensis]EPC00580.1 hypothetical protein L861_06480 [Halomonas anticariensis FP35 = DSM 16096]